MRESELIRAALRDGMPDRERVRQACLDAADAAKTADAPVRVRRMTVRRIAAAVGAVAAVIALTAAVLLSGAFRKADGFAVTYVYQPPVYSEYADRIVRMSPFDWEEQCYNASGEHRPDHALVRAVVLPASSPTLLGYASTGVPPENQNAGCLIQRLEITAICHAGADTALAVGDRMTVETPAEWQEDGTLTVRFSAHRLPLVEGKEYFVYVLHDPDDPYRFSAGVTHWLPLDDCATLPGCAGIDVPENALREWLLAHYGDPAENEP